MVFYQKYTPMINEELISLIDYSAPYCVSIISPVHSRSPERQQDHLVIQKAVEAAKTLIKMKANRKDKSADLLIERLEDAYRQIDFIHLKKGIGIFVGSEMGKVVHFPFDVHQKIAVNSSFAALELFYYLYREKTYKLLAVRQHAVHLFNGYEDVLSEVMNEDFPSIYEEEFEYTHASKIVSHGSTVMKQYEKDTHQLQEIRQKEFYRKTDDLLTKYINQDEVVMLSAGTNEMSNFKSVSQHKKLIDGELLGSFSFKDNFTLGKKAWDKLQEVAHFKMDQMILQFQELIGRNLAVFGLQQVIHAAEEAKGRNLLIDKDFNFLGHVTANGLAYHPGTRSKDKEHFVVNEVYERILRLVRKSGGNIVFVDKGMLDNWEGIAMQLRYP